ncbi:hypothetical protein [Klebsiella pneumoniae IS53]|nr:hypothetical protein [Klebsiella pneumoniae IS53]
MSCDADKSALRQKPVGQMVRRFLHIQGLFIYNDIHYPRCGETKR